MSSSPEEVQEARNAFTWADAPREIANATRYTLMEAARFFGQMALVPASGPRIRHLGDVGIHPYDLVSMVYQFTRTVGYVDPYALLAVIVAAFEAGQEAGR